jgi:hypothetical protein
VQLAREGPGNRATRGQLSEKGRASMSTMSAVVQQLYDVPRVRDTPDVRKGED